MRTGRNITNLGCIAMRNGINLYLIYAVPVPIKDLIY
jgi:hypothetical protein